MVDQPQLKGIRVLVVEDDDLSSLVAQEMLVELGCVVTGAERSVDGALATLENDGPFDCVMLDVRLGAERACEAQCLFVRNLANDFSGGVTHRDDRVARLLVDREIQRAAHASQVRLDLGGNRLQGFVGIRLGRRLGDRSLGRRGRGGFA